MCHPKTPNLGGSLLTLPHPFFDLRRPLEGERLMVLGTFPGLLEVFNNPEAGPLPPEQIQQWVRMLGKLNEGRFPMLERLLLATNVRRQHEKAKKALITTGRSRELIEKWPHFQVALMHALLEYDQLIDEFFQWQAMPYWQREKPLEAYEKKVRASRIPGPDSPAIPLAWQMLPASQKVLLSRDRLERQFAALRLIEAIRLYGGTHEGKLPPTLAAIKEVPLPVCPLTGKSFEYRLAGGRAFLSAPPAPPSAPTIQPLRYEIRFRKPDNKREVQP